MQTSYCVAIHKQAMTRTLSHSDAQIALIRRAVRITLVITAGGFQHSLSHILPALRQSRSYAHPAASRHRCFPTHRRRLRCHLKRQMRMQQRTQTLHSPPPPPQQQQHRLPTQQSRQRPPQRQAISSAPRRRRRRLGADQPQSLARCRRKEQRIRHRPGCCPLAVCARALARASLQVMAQSPAPCRRRCRVRVGPCAAMAA